MEERDEEWPAGTLVTVSSVFGRLTSAVIRPTRAIEAIPATTPFIGPEQLMRETGQRELVRLGANESAFGPSPKAVAAMSRELTRLSWYGDPESLDLRDALAEKHACRPRTDRRRLGHRRSDGLGRARVRGTRRCGARYARNVSDLQLSRGRIRRTPDRGRRIATTARPISTRWWRRRGESDPRSSISLIPTIRADASSGRDEIDALLRGAAARQPLAARRGLCRFRRRGRAACRRRFEDRLIRLRTFSKAYGMAGARIGYALATERNARTFQKIRLHYGINRNAQIGALASLARR